MALAWEQTRIFLWAIAVGAGIMALYDLFRILRLAFAQREWMIFLEDVCFFAVAGMVTWFYLLESCKGQLRGFVFIGEGIGAVLYFLTLGQLVMAASKSIIALLSRLIHAVIIRPACALIRLVMRILNGMQRAVRAVFKWLGIEKLADFLKKYKKRLQIRKFHLPESGSLLYNLGITGVWPHRAKASSNQKQEVENGAESVFSSDK